MRNLENNILVLKDKNKSLTKELNKLKKEFNDYQQESVKWSVEDFIEQAKSDGYRCSKKLAKYILRKMIRRHDASEGICWITLSSYIQEYCTPIKTK